MIYLIYSKTNILHKSRLIEVILPHAQIYINILKCVSRWNAFLHGGEMRERNHFVGVWLDDKEYIHLNQLCTTSGLSASAVLRQILSGTQLRPRPPDQYTALLRELSAIGNNINQIAHWANAARSIREPEIVEAAVLAHKAWELVKNGLWQNPGHPYPAG